MIESDENFPNSRRAIWLCGLAAQALGAGAALATVWLGAITTDGFSAAWPVAILAGVVAAIAGHTLFRLPPWWIVINGGFPLAVSAAVGVGAGWVYGALFALTVLIFWNVLRDRVPLYLSNRHVAIKVAAIAREATTGKGHAATALDLGSGPGGFCLRLADALKDWTVVGIESSPLLYLIGVVRRAIARSPQNLDLQYGDIWEADVSDSDIVYAFLSPEPMPRLFDKLKREMPKGSLFISNSFEVPGQIPDDLIDVGDTRGTRLYLWRI